MATQTSSRGAKPPCCEGGKSSTSQYHIPIVYDRVRWRRTRSATTGVRSALTQSTVVARTASSDATNGAAARVPVVGSTATVEHGTPAARRAATT